MLRRGGFPAESVANGSVIAVKTHEFGSDPLNGVNISSYDKGGGEYYARTVQGAAANREQGFVACSAGRWADTVAALFTCGEASRSMDDN